MAKLGLTIANRRAVCGVGRSHQGFSMCITFVRVRIKPICLSILVWTLDHTPDVSELTMTLTELPSVYLTYRTVRETVLDIFHSCAMIWTATCGGEGGVFLYGPRSRVTVSQLNHLYCSLMFRSNTHIPERWHHYRLQELVRMIWWDQQYISSLLDIQAHLES